MERRIVYLIASLICVLGVPNAKAALITHDEAFFYSIYTSPTETIDFTRLKDGSTFEELESGGWLTSPYINSYSSGPNGNSFSVDEDAWSDNYLIRSTWGGYSFWLATDWYGDSIRPHSDLTTMRRLSVHLLSDTLPISLYVESDSYNGFVGFIPQTAQDTEIQYLLPNLQVLSMQGGFSKVSQIPEPDTLWLLLSGMAGVVGIGFRPSKSFSIC